MRDRIGRLAAAAVLLAAALALRGEGRPAPPRPRAVGQLEGVSLRITLPYSEYGPGAPVKVMATFRNRGTRTVRFAPPVEVEAVLVVEGKPLLYPQDSALEAVRQKAVPPVVVLEPGEDWMAALTLRPGRKDLLAGDYPLRVYAVVAPPADAPAHGRGAGPRGTLVSNEVVLRIRYNVLWVG